MQRATIIAAVILLTMFLSGPARAGDQDFTLHNRTGYDIYHLYIAPSKSDSWEEDMLDGKMLQNGAEIDITFGNKVKPAHWDIRIEDKEGNALYWRDINLKEATDVVLEPDGVARIK